ncbi:MAG TPA: nuclease-related domain-containing protein, partial [Arthrobacter sp.]
LAGNRPGQRIEALDDASYRAGVAGEQRTAGVLAGLERQGYRVLHSLPLSARKDLDHLVIGPSGIFAINTKATTYEVTVKAGGVYADGYRQNWQDSIERDASVVAELLSVAARMELVCEPLVSVWSAVGVRSPGGAVAAGESLQDTILGRPALYPPEWVDVVFNVARRSDTWSLQGTGRH